MLIKLNGYSAAVAIGLATVVSVGCSSESNPKPVNAELKPVSTEMESLRWGNCENATQFQCAELEVPMDHSQIDGEKITLALIRKPASGQRIGSLLFNPGGPGGSGVDLIKTFGELNSIPSGVLADYDVVGFDPRGVGGSTPVDCAEFGLDEINGYPVGLEAVRDMHAQITEFSAACVNKNGAYLQQLGSLNVVRDMESIRIALGEDKLNFIGYSYGTRLAALYLQEYPVSSGRMVLDGNVHPDSAVTRLVREALPAFQSNLRLLMSQCTLTDAACDVDQLMSKLASRINELATDPASQAEFEALGELVVAGIEDPEFGALVADPIISYLNTGDIGVLQEFTEFLQALGGDSEQSDDSEQSNEDNETAQIAVLCADDAYRPSDTSLVELADELNQISDVLAEAHLTLAAVCSAWPEALEPLPVIGTSIAPLSLVIGGTTDAQTPIEWSEIMAQAIGGHFIRSEHPGHTAVFTGKSECLDDVVEKFLQDGLAPAVAECGEEGDS